MGVALWLQRGVGRGVSWSYRRGRGSRSRFLRRLRSDLTRSLLILKNEFGRGYNVLRTGIRGKRSSSVS